MMKKVEFETYQALLKNQSLSISKIPKSILNSYLFISLIEANILQKIKAGRGFKITINKKSEFKKFFETHFPQDNVPNSKSGNIKKYRDSKATSVDNNPIFLLRGFQTVNINHEWIDMTEYTKKFGLFSVIPNCIVATKICFTENLEVFLNAEKRLGMDYLFMHKYGRVGVDSIQMMQAQEVLVLLDYDFNGLDEYLRIKQVHPNAKLFMPNNYDDLFVKYAKTLKDNNAKPSKRVKESDDPLVVKIREQIAKHNRFLEQEILIDV